MKSLHIVPMSSSPDKKGLLIDQTWFGYALEQACGYISSDGTLLVLTLVRRDKHAATEKEACTFELYNHTGIDAVPKKEYREEKFFPYGSSVFDMCDWVEKSMTNLLKKYDNQNVPDHPPVNPCETCEYFFSTLQDGTNKTCNHPDGRCGNYRRYKGLVAASQN